MLASLLRVSGRRVARNVSVSAARRRIVEIQSEEDFQRDVIQSDIPVIVDFHATWCGPCRSLAPLLEGVASEREGRVKLAKVDVDTLPDLALQYEVSAVPAVVGVKEGKVVAQFVGLKDSHFLDQFASCLEESSGDTSI